MEFFSASEKGFLKKYILKGHIEANMNTVETSLTARFSFELSEGISDLSGEHNKGWD